MWFVVKTICQLNFFLFLLLSLTAWYWFSVSLICLHSGMKPWTVCRLNSSKYASHYPSWAWWRRRRRRKKRKRKKLRKISSSQVTSSGQRDPRKAGERNSSACFPLFQNNVFIFRIVIPIKHRLNHKKILFGGELQKTWSIRLCIVLYWEQVPGIADFCFDRILTEKHIKLLLSAKPLTHGLFL